jgi:Zn-dependent peptidase ImmA (M78 family)/transcriptional regulator with XRE-family HTH domain
MLDQRDSSSISAGDVGAALGNLRVAKGLGVNQLSECLGISESVIEAIENGAIDGHLEEIYGLLCIYAEPTHEVFKGFFKRPLSDRGNSSDDLTAYVMDCISFHKEMQGKSHYLSGVPRARGKSRGQSTEFLDSASKSKSKRKITPSSVLEFRAQEVINKHGLYRLPINVYQVAENLGAHVIFESLPNDFYMKLKAFCYKEDGFSLIGINKNHPVVLQRYSLAHELHHLLYDFNAQSFTCGPGNESKDVEVDAEKFAAELLMPRNMIERLISNPLNISYLTINLVAQHFGVSYEAAAIRLEKFGLINSSKDACGRSYRNKDKQKTDFLLNTKEKYLKAVFGLETGIVKLQEYHETIAYHSLCGAPITDNTHKVCWRCGLDLNPPLAQYFCIKNPYRQKPSNLLPNKIKPLQKIKEKDSNQLSLNLRVNL